MNTYSLTLTVSHHWQTPTVSQQQAAAPFNTTSVAASHSNQKRHDPLPQFYPPDASQIAMYLLVAVALAIAAAAGMGGENLGGGRGGGGRD
jgi:hypothetical protein